MNMKSCELCKSSSARMYCESDQASLCWDCDAKVHSANFLVARHSRSLLCHVCQSPTPWNASGAKLGRTVSVCESCFDGCEQLKEENSGGNGEENDEGYEGESDGEEEYDEEDDEEIGGDDEDGDNQVVPWSSTPPPGDESSSNSEESSSRFFNGDGVVSLKQLRENSADLCSDADDHCCSSVHRENGSPLAPRDSETVVVESLRPLKRQRTEPTGTSKATIVETIDEMCNLRKSREPSVRNLPECH